MHKNVGRRLKKWFGGLWLGFMFPYGIKRNVNPMKWRPIELVIVLIQCLTVAMAITSLMSEALNVWPCWMPLSSAILSLISTSLIAIIVLALVWHTVSAGDLPLTNRRAHYIRQVVQAMELEKQGAVMDWENIDPRGGIPFKKPPPGWHS